MTLRRDKVLAPDRARRRRQQTAGGALSAQLHAALQLRTSHYIITRKLVEEAVAVGYRAPRYRYLTRSFVEALELAIVPIRVRRNQGVISRGTGGTLPIPSRGFIFEGVEFEGWRYLRDDDGLSYDVLGPM